MKKFRSGLLALALVAGVTGAFASKVHFAKADDVTYSWTSPDQGSFVGTEDEAIAHYGCDNGPNLCASGTAPGQDPVTLQRN